VIRPDQHYRGFAGQIAAGTIHRGDTIVALPSGRTSKVASITTFDGDLDKASAPLSIALTLEDELDISRGDVISIATAPPLHATALEASVVWFDSARLETHRSYLLKHGSQTLPARVTRVLHRTNIQTLTDEAVNSLGMNDIGVVEIESTRPIFFDPYAENRATGSFILIDPQTNATAAAGMIRRALDSATAATKPTHKAALLLIPNPQQAADVESALIAEGHPVVKTRLHSESILKSLLSIGLLVILEQTPVEPLGLEHQTLTSTEPHAVSDFLNHLRALQILPAQKEN
jgi:sulfate adenylyltransferase subunit 1 (EFTu-like GTPase family)